MIGHLSPTLLIVGALISYVLPLAGSLLNVGKLPIAASGIITAVLAVATGFLGEWAAKGEGYDWRQGAINAIGAYILASVARRQSWAGTRTDEKLLAVGKPGVVAGPAV